MKINMNAICNVKLTDAGIKQLKKEYVVAYEHNYNSETQILSIELWHIMNLFAPMLFNGQMVRELPFVDNEIEIEEE